MFENDQSDVPRSFDTAPANGNYNMLKISTADTRILTMSC